MNSRGRDNTRDETGHTGQALRSIGRQTASAVPAQRAGRPTFGSWAHSGPASFADLPEYNQGESWDYQDEAEYRPTPTVGSVVDSFRALSAEDQQVFLSIVGGMMEIPSPAPLVGATQQSLPIRPVRNAPLPAGVTQHPVSGKLFRVEPKKERTAPYLQLEGEYSTARANLAAIMRRKNYEFVVDTRETRVVGHPDQLVSNDTDPEWGTAKDAVERTKLALKGYKQAHGEEFTAPPPGRGGRPRRGRGVPIVRGAQRPQTGQTGQGPADTAGGSDPPHTQ